MGCANSKSVVPTSSENLALQIPVSELRIKIPSDSRKTHIVHCRRGAGIKFDESLPTFNVVLN